MYMPSALHTMASDDNKNKDAADLFAIPDFWQSSSCRLNDTSLAGIQNRNPLFALNLSETYHSLLSDIDSPQQSLQESHVFTPDDIPTDGFFKLPPILKDLALHQPRPQHLSQVEDHPDVPESHPSISDQDIWLQADHDLVKQPEYMTWDRFGKTEPDQVCPSPVFNITEAGPAAFDALGSQGRESHDTEPDVVQDSLYCACLLNLALGRSSLLFSWHDEQKAFVKYAPQLRTSGLSLQLVQSIDKICLDCANAIRFLQAFTRKTFSNPSTPTRVALAGVVDRLVLTVQTELGARGRLTRSILQLQSIVRPVHLVLSYFQRLVEKLTKQPSEEGMLSRLFQEVQSTEHRDGLLREAIAEVLTLTSKPWTDFVEEWIGLKPEDGTGITKRGPGKGFVKVADRFWIDDLGFELEEPDFFLDEEKMPSFVATEVAQTIFEAGRNIRFLREHHPDHPLSRQDIVASTNPPKLEWKFDWDSIQRLEKKANEYHDAVLATIQEGSSWKHPTGPLSDSTKQHDGYKLDYFGKTDEQITASVIASISQLDQPLRRDNPPTDKLATLLRARLDQGTSQPVHDQDLSPHWSLVPLLSFSPVIDVQSALVNQECMRLLFSAHDLRVHIDLLKQYYLMGNGLLCSRLSHALFDTNLETAERKSGVALGGGLMGLRLGGRENWPPASSELRLALMGVLSDSYQPPHTGGSRGTKPATASSTPTSRIYTSDLPGDLSFAVRDLSPEEIDRCMDPHAIEALDFLQLSYKTPPPLRAVLTPVVLAKYDRIFRFLLRLLRMLYIVNQQLFREVVIPPPITGGSNHHHHNSSASIRLRIESRHFVNQVAAYVFSTGITAAWTRFDTWLDGVQADLAEGMAATSSGANLTTTRDRGGRNHQQQQHSPDRLQRRQEQVLDDIMSALLLRKRQGPVLKLMEEIFGVILRFSKLSRGRVGGGDGKGETVEDLYRLFRKGVEVFITVCRGLGEKKAAADGVGGERSGRGDGEGGSAGGVGNPIETLVLMLDMGGFYVKRG